MSLVEYGIQNEESHLRVHVCFDVGKIYVFPTKRAAEDCLSGKFPVAAAKTEGIVTAKGWLAPIAGIRECQGIPIPGDVLRNEEPKDGASHSERRRMKHAHRNIRAKGLGHADLHSVKAWDENNWWDLIFPVRVPFGAERRIPLVNLIFGEGKDG